jgi:hypothetical protein
MRLTHLRRGGRRLLDRLLWYGRTFGHIQQTQKKLGKALGPLRRDPSSGKTVHSKVSENSAGVSAGAASKRR